MSATGVQYISPKNNTFAPAQTNSLQNVIQKVRNILQSRWALVAAVGFATMFAAGFVWGALATVVASVTAYFAPVSVKEMKDLVVFTANVLGIFSDPFEFDGDYGEFINGVKREVEGLIIGKALQEPSEEEIAEDLQYGPTLEELLPCSLRKFLLDTCSNRGFDRKKVKAILTELQTHKPEKLFYFLKHCPPSLLNVDKIFRLAAKEANKPFPMPIINSSVPIVGKTSLDQKKHLADVLFTLDNLQLAKNIDKELETELENSEVPLLVAKTTAAVVPEEIEEEAGPEAEAGPELRVHEAVDPDFVRLFSSKEGQLIFYFLYQSMNIHLVSHMMDRVNQAKVEFAKKLGDPQKRAQFFAEKFAAENADVVFAQECDRYLPQEMAKLGYFSTERKPVPDKEDPANIKWELNSKDGSVIFLNSKTFKGASIHPYDEEEDPKHKTTVITADFFDAQRPVVLASCHVSDGNNLKIFSILNRVTEIYQKDKDAGAVVIGLDANPQSKEQESDIRERLKEKGLKTIKVGNTEVKRRKITLLHKKINLLFRREKNMIIADAQTNFDMKNGTVGFKKPPLDSDMLLPHEQIPSDQAPVGVKIVFKC